MPATVGVKGRRPADVDRKARAAFGLILAVLAAWTAWVLLLRAFPAALSGPAVGLLPRVLILLLPALVFLALSEGSAFPRTLGLTRRAGVGVAWGVAGALVVPGLAIAARAVGGGLARKGAPDPAALLSAAVLTPLAEELMFRGVAFRAWRKALGEAPSALACAAAFALLHLPWYALTMPPAEAALAFGGVFLYGFGFAVLFWASGSLWAPLTAHALNNLAMSLLRV